MFVVIGNPPYNAMGRSTKMTTTKIGNMKIMDKLVKDTYADDSRAITQSRHCLRSLCEGNQVGIGPD